MTRRSQLAMFMILGFVLLLTVLVMYALAPIKLSVESEYGLAPVEVMFAVRSQFESCLADYMAAVMTVFGLEGGQLVRVEDEGTVLPVRTLYERGKNVLPSVDDWTLVLQKAASVGTEECARNVSVEGTVVTVGAHAEEVLLAADGTQLVVRNALAVTGPDYRSILQETAIQIPVRLAALHAAADSIITRLVTDPDNIPFSTIEKQGFVVKAVKQNNEHFLYVLRDEQVMLNGNPFEFMFAAEYGNEVSVDESPPEFLNGDKTFHLKVGVHFSFQLEVKSQQRPQYLDDSELFVVSETGAIGFTPALENAGIHLVNVIAKTKRGDASTQLLFIIEQ